MEIKNTQEIVAIFHSIEGIGHYQVEVKQSDRSFYICEKDNKPKTFGNIAEAKLAALKQNATKAYLALGSASDELIDANPSKEAPSQLDLMPINLIDDNS